MRAIILLISAALVIAGCGKEPKEEVAGTPPTPPGATPTGPSSGITPVGPNVGGITPVTGDVGGTSGGGVASAAKDQAREAAAGMGSGSMQPVPTDDGGEGDGDGN